MNIYDFIDNPFKAVKAGYRPSYLTCVSAVSNNWWTFCVCMQRGFLRSLKTF